MTMTTSGSYYFTFEKDWRQAPLAFWVHVPAPGRADQWQPPVPRPIPHRGFVFLRVVFGAHELLFSSPAQLDHCIAVLAAKPLPTSRQLSARRGAAYGPNGHWLSRLPARLKSPRVRERLVGVLRAVRGQAVGPGENPAFVLLP